MDLIQFGIVLKAFDQMSGVFGSAAGKSMGAIGQLDARVGALSDRLDRLGTKALGDGSLLAGMMQKPIAAFAEAEDAATGLKVSMLGAGSELDARYGKISKLATQLGDTLPGTTADFQNMMSALVKQGISYDAILGGVGKSAAYLGVLLKKPPEQAAEFVAKMQDATGTAESDMMSLMDTVQRATYLGVDDSNMLQFYTKMAPAMDTMRRKGAEAARDMAPFAVMFDQMGMAGESSGNALRKAIQLGMDTKKVAKANAELASKGIKLDFTDGKGEFGGMANLMAQLDKLKGLNKVDQLAALKEIFGDDSETLQVLSKLIDKGADGYNDVVDRMAKQATLQQRVNVQLGTLKNLWDSATGTFTNTLAAFGEMVSPELKALTEWLGEASSGMSAFIAEHPKLARAAGIAVGGLAGLLLVGGALAVTLGTVSRLAGYALGPIGKLGGLLGKKGAGGAAGAAAEAAADKLGVQRVWVTNWPGSGFDAGGSGGGGGGSKPGGAAGKTGGRLSRLGNAVKTGVGRLGVGRLAGAAVAVGAAGYMAYDTYKNAKTGEDKGKGYGGAAGSLAGGLAGAKVGALVGTMVLPGVGTAIGGLIGSAAGAFFGDKLGSLAGGALGRLADKPAPVTGTPRPTLPSPFVKLAAPPVPPAAVVPSPMVKLAAPTVPPAAVVPSPMVKLAAPPVPPAAVVPSPMVKLAAPPVPPAVVVPSPMVKLAAPPVPPAAVVPSPMVKLAAPPVPPAAVVPSPMVKLAAPPVPPAAVVPSPMVKLAAPPVPPAAVVPSPMVKLAAPPVPPAAVVPSPMVKLAAPPVPPAAVVPSPVVKLAAPPVPPAAVVPSLVVKLAAPPVPPAAVVPSPVVKLAAPPVPPAAVVPSPLVKLAAPPAAVNVAVPKSAPAPQPVPLNPVAAAKSNAKGEPAKVVSPTVTLNYNPTLTIQGDPLPGTAEKFKKMLAAHRDEILRMVNQAIENKARAAY